MKTSMVDLHRILDRCAQGNAEAWRTLYDLHNNIMILHIIKLTHGAGGPEHAEEIAAAVWSSLCSEDYRRLRRYAPRFGSFSRYLRLLARHEVWKRRRADRNRQARESRAARSEATPDECERRLVIQEFLATLSPREREFCLASILDDGERAGPLVASTANQWQLRSRVLKKFRAYWSQNR